jgi:hypothetical protein
VSSCPSKTDRFVPFQAFLDRMSESYSAPDDAFSGHRRPPACDWTSLIETAMPQPAVAKPKVYFDADATDAGGEDVASHLGESVARELQLSADMSPAALERIRRAFAFRNHPDRVGPAGKKLALLRMTEANALIDTALKAARARIA